MYNGSAITGLLAGFLGATNFYYKDDLFVDASGLGFTTAGNSVNFSVQSSNGMYRVTQTPFATAFVQASSSAVQPAVPEPSTWAMMLFGFGALGFAMRRRRKDGRVLFNYA
jgi:hypothetical protein